MKRPLLLSGAVALVFLGAPVLPAFSQSMPDAMPKMERLGKNLNLSAEQKAKMQQIRESSRSKIEAVLTPEQRAQWTTIQQQRQQRRQAMTDLNLTDDQKARIRAIRQEAKQEMETVLTNEQRQKLNERHQQMRQRRQQRSDF